MGGNMVWDHRVPILETLNGERNERKRLADKGKNEGESVKKEGQETPRMERVTGGSRLIRTRRLGLGIISSRRKKIKMGV
jgi:hypothetical protein